MDRSTRSVAARRAEGFAAFALVFAGCGAIVADARYDGALGAVGIGAGLRAGDHGDGLRDRPPLRRPHQPGGDARVHADAALPAPRGRRLHRRAGGRRAWPRRLLLLAVWPSQPADLGATVPSVGVGSALVYEMRADRGADVRDHGRGHRHPRRRRRGRDRDRRRGGPRRVVRRAGDRRVDEPGALARPGARRRRVAATSGSTSSGRSRARPSARSPTSWCARGGGRRWRASYSSACTTPGARR